MVQSNNDRGLSWEADLGYYDIEMTCWEDYRDSIMDWCVGGVASYCSHS